MTGIFEFTTDLDHTDMGFFGVGEGTVFYHESNQRPVPLKEGENVFIFDGQYTILGTFQEMGVSSVHHYEPYCSPFESGSITRWENTDTKRIPAAFFQSNLRTMVQPPKTVTDMTEAFGECEHIPDVSGWDVSGVENMTLMFHNCPNFQQDLSQWDVSNVKFMREMFWNATSFNGDLSTWDTSSAIDMRRMFYGAASFQNAGKPLDYWDMQSLMFWEEIFKETKVPLSEQHFWEHQILDNISYQ